MGSTIWRSRDEDEVTWKGVRHFTICTDWSMSWSHHPYIWRITIWNMIIYYCIFSLRFSVLKQPMFVCHGTSITITFFHSFLIIFSNYVIVVLVPFQTLILCTGKKCISVACCRLTRYFNWFFCTLFMRIFMIRIVRSLERYLEHNCLSYFFL